MSGPLFEGSITALITPFKDGQLDETALNRVLGKAVGGADCLFFAPAAFPTGTIRMRMTIAVSYATMQRPVGAPKE